MKPKWLSLRNVVASSTTRSRWLAYGVAVVGPSVAMLLVWALERGVPITPPYPLFTLTIVLSALLGGLYPGLVALALSLFYTEILILPPRYSLLISDRREWLRFAAFALVGMVVSVLVAKLRREHVALTYSETRFRALIAATSDVVYSMSPDWSEMRHLRSQNFLAPTETPSRAMAPKSFTLTIKRTSWRSSKKPFGKRAHSNWNTGLSVQTAAWDGRTHGRPSGRALCPGPQGADRTRHDDLSIGCTSGIRRLIKKTSVDCSARCCLARRRQQAY